MAVELKEAPEGSIRKIVGRFFSRAEESKDPDPDTPSADWEAMEPFWTKVNDIVEGQDAVRRNGRKYLPKFPNESANDYEFRRETAKFTNVYRDIVENLSQKPFAKEVTLSEDTPDQILELVEDIDGRGNHLNVFAADTFFNGINKALDWILVDYTNSGGARTVEEERRIGARPYWVHVPAEKVIWIESQVVEGREQLTFVKIEERKGLVRQYTRGIDEDGIDRVVWELLQEPANPDEPWVLVDSGEITIGVIPLVPFITGRRKGSKWQFHPPMKDAADLQIELYQQETNLKHIKTMSAFPMLAGNGVNPPQDATGEPEDVQLGPASVLYAPMDGSGSHGEWTWLEPTADTMKFLSGDVENTEQQLRELGRQPLTANSGNLTVITTAFAAAKGNSAVQMWALGLKDALENALLLTARWLNIDFEPEVSVFTDFGIEDSGEEVPKLLLEMRVPQSGDPQISQQTFWEELKRRGILSAEFDTERETERLFMEFPSDDDINSPDGQE